MVLYKKILECKLEFPFDISASCKDMIKRLLSINPEKRIKLKEIKEHAFFQLGLKQMKKREFVFDNKVLTNKTVDKLVKLGYKLSEIKAAVRNNESNSVSTAYHLVYNKVKSLAYKKSLQGAKDSTIVKIIV